MSKRYDLRIQAGTDEVRIFIVCDHEGNALPLDGCTARSQIRPYPTSETILDEMTTENGRLECMAEGKLRMLLPNDVTSGFSFEEAVYDLELVLPDTKVIRLIEGLVKVSKEVTR